MILQTLKKALGIFKNVSVSDIHSSKFDARDSKLEANNNPELKELTESVKTTGLVEPLIVRENTEGDGYETVAGSRRLRVLKSLGADQVPVIIRNDLSDLDVRIFSLVENIHRKTLEEDEIMDCLSSIYEDSKDDWKPENPTEAENLIIKEHGWAELAKSYLKRMHNETSGVIKAKSSEKAKAIDYNNVLSQPNKSNERSYKQEIKPTPEFRELAHRVAYAYSTQYNILRGAGSFRSDVDYLAELPEDIQKIIEEGIKKAIEEDKALKEHEKLQREKELKQKAAWKYQIRTKTKKPQSERSMSGRKRASETKAKKKPTHAQQAATITQKIIKSEKEKKQAKETANQKTQWITKSTNEGKQTKEPKPQISPVRARERITVLCSELFELLTAQKLNMGDLNVSERIATSKQAKDNMNALAAFYADAGDRGTQQAVIIPTNNALSEYRDILYQAVEKARKQDEMMRP